MEPEESNTRWDHQNLGYVGRIFSSSSLRTVGSVHHKTLKNSTVKKKIDEREKEER